MDFSSLTSLEDLRNALEQSQNYQLTVDKKIDQCLQRWPSIASQAEQLSRLAPTIDLLESDADRLSNVIHFTSKLADSISSKVRQLDTAKTRVFEAIQRVDDILDLNYCTDGVQEALEKKDYESAAKHIYKYLCLDENVLRQTVPADSSESITDSLKTLENARTQLTELVNAKFDHAVSKNDENQVYHFFKIFPLLKLHDLGLEKFSGYICGLIQKQVSQQLETIYSYEPDHPRQSFMFADALAKLLEAVAFNVENKRALVETYCGPGKVYELLKFLQNKCDELALDILARFKQKRHLKAIKQKVDQSLKVLQSPNNIYNDENDKTRPIRVEELNDLLIEIALMSSQFEVYMGFVKRRAIPDIDNAFPINEDNEDNISISSTNTQSPLQKRQDLYDALKTWTNSCKLATEMRKLTASYVQFEEFVITEGIQKSIDKDDLDSSVLNDLIDKMSLNPKFHNSQNPSNKLLNNNSTGNNNNDHIETIPLTSLCVDSTFYVLRTSLQRTIRTKSLEPTCAMLMLCHNVLTVKLANHIQKAINNGYPSGASITETLGLDALSAAVNDRNNDEPQIDRSKFEFLAACNNAEKAMNNISSFTQQLKESILTHFVHVNNSDHKRLDQCLQELKTSNKIFQELLDLALQELNTQSLRHQIKPQIANFLSVNRVLTEEEHAEYQANDPWVQQVIYTMDDLLTSFRQILSDTIYSKLIAMLTAQVTTHLEQLIKKSCFNQLGAFQLENELRNIITYLTGTSSRSVRHLFAKLLQISRLLNLERPSELLDYWGVNAGSMTWLLTPGDIRTVLNLRQDFSKDEIRRLQL